MTDEQPAAIYVQFAENGLMRKWDYTPFPSGVRFTSLDAAAIREARAAAIEEAVKLCEASLYNPPPNEGAMGWNACCDHLAAAIRALLDKPPTAQEEG